MIVGPLSYVLGAGCLALAVIAGVQTVRLDRAQDAIHAGKEALKDEQIARGIERDQAKSVALSAHAEYRQREAADAARIKEAQDAGRKKTERAERVAAALRADNDRMRNDLADYARAGSGGAASDTIEACRSRAAELAEAVAHGMRVQHDMAKAFASLAVDYGVLHDGWPGVTKD